MKKLLIAFVLSLSLFGSKACDICGCSVSNYNPFLFPHQQKNYFSLSFSHRIFHLNPGTAEAQKQHYNSLLLSGQFSISKRLQVSAVIPYQINRLTNNFFTRDQNGIGDISLFMNYKLLDKMSKQMRHSIIIGGGIKLPTGVAPDITKEDTGEENFYLGSGSTDFLLNTSYRLSLRKWVFSAAASYKYNTNNKNDFRYGDLITASATAAYKFDMDNISITPYAQIANETHLKDAAKHEIQDQTGGNVLLAGGGFDISTKKITLGLNYQAAPLQDLDRGIIKVKPIASAHISIIL